MEERATSALRLCWCVFLERKSKTVLLLSLLFVQLYGLPFLSRILAVPHFASINTTTDAQETGCCLDVFTRSLHSIMASNFFKFKFELKLKLHNFFFPLASTIMI